jgi:acyl-CoA synthetase (AMP-forming)/AMP-acid ligase II
MATGNITDNGGGICVGYPVAGVDISIIAITDNNIAFWHENLALPANTIGEIVVKGPMVSQSYYHRKKATKNAKIINAGDRYSSDSLKNTMQVHHRMGDLGYLDDLGKLWMCGRKGHRVESTVAENTYYSIPCERIFNLHERVKRSALVGVVIEGNTLPLMCIELEEPMVKKESHQDLFDELRIIGHKNEQTAAIDHFLVHPSFPVDIRHNAKIFREKLAVWAQEQLSKK